MPTEPDLYTRLSRWPAGAAVLILYAIPIALIVVWFGGSPQPNEPCGNASLGAPFGGFFLIGIWAGAFMFGAFGVVVGFTIRGLGRLFVPLGLIAVYCTATTSPFSGPHIADKLPSIPKLTPELKLEGKYRRDDQLLVLRADSTFEFHLDERWWRKGIHSSGDWRIEDNRILLVDYEAARTRLCQVFECEGHLYVGNPMPADLDGWSGDMGLKKVLTTDPGELP